MLLARCKKKAWGRSSRLFSSPTPMPVCSLTPSSADLPHASPAGSPRDALHGSAPCRSPPRASEAEGPRFSGASSSTFCTTDTQRHPRCNPPHRISSPTFFAFSQGPLRTSAPMRPVFHVFRPRRTHCALMIAFEETRPFRRTVNACPSEHLGAVVFASPRSPQRVSIDSLNECPLPFGASTCNKSSASVLCRPEISLVGCHPQKNLLQTNNSCRTLRQLLEIFSHPLMRPVFQCNFMHIRVI